MWSHYQIEGGKEQAYPIKSMMTENASHDMDNVGNCFTSFLGSSSLPFDIQRNLFGDSSASQSQMSPMASQPDKTSSPVDSSEGKPIEVISMRSKSDDIEESFDISSFLKSLSDGSSMNTSGGIPGLGDPLPVPPPTMPPTTTPYSYPLSLGNSAMPLEPPPLPPLMSTNLYSSQSSMTNESEPMPIIEREEQWKTTLPPKFPTWRDADNEWERDSVGSDHIEAGDWVPALPVNKVPVNIDTPESPPHFEKESFREPVEYDETSVGTVDSSADIDHRMLVTLSNRTLDRSAHSAKDTDHRVLNTRFKKDVDHRNLISLTSSPAQEVLAPPPTPPPQLWPQDQDYRSIPMPPPNSDVDHRDHRDHAGGDLDYRRIRPPETPVGVGDNVESVDMEMSDEDEEFHAHHRGSQEKPSRFPDEQKFASSWQPEPSDVDIHRPDFESAIPSMATQPNASFPPLPPPPPPPMPQPDFKTDLRVPPPALDFLGAAPPMRTNVRDVFGGRQSLDNNVLAEPPFQLPPDFPPCPPPMPLMPDGPPSRAPLAVPLPPPRAIALPSNPSPIPNSHMAGPLRGTNNLRLDLRRSHSPAQRRSSLSSRESSSSPMPTHQPPSLLGLPPIAPPMVPSTTPPVQDPGRKTPMSKPPAQSLGPPPAPASTGPPSGPEESDTDSMEQYMSSTVGLSDDEEFRAIFGEMDPQFICDVVEGPSRNGVDLEISSTPTNVSNGEKPPQPDDVQVVPPSEPSALSAPPTPTALLDTPSRPPSLLGTPITPGNPQSGRGAFTPRGRPWKQRGGRGGSPMTHSGPRFHGASPAVSPAWGHPHSERSPFPHGRGRPGFRAMGGMPRGIPFRAVMRGNPRFGGW